MILTRFMQHYNGGRVVDYSISNTVAVTVMRETVYLSKYKKHPPEWRNPRNNEYKQIVDALLTQPCFSMSGICEMYEKCTFILLTCNKSFRVITDLASSAQSRIGILNPQLPADVVPINVGVKLIPCTLDQIK